MTIAQLKETLLGKILLQLGLFGDGTSFGDLDINDISKELLKLGYEQHGNEVMYNGLTENNLPLKYLLVQYSISVSNIWLMIKHIAGQLVQK